MRRIHTTLDTHAFERLQRLAQEQKKTISQIVREAVLSYLQIHQPQDAQDFDAVLEKLRQIRQRNAEKYGPYNGDLGDLIRDIRED
ncbi:MAG: ribbon-helix-helix protein, CopG family [Thermanaerothrix sp.]|nr:ribbon-helix-helix protein, CopG family [Thermanaerothrix sp.]